MKLSAFPLYILKGRGDPGGVLYRLVALDKKGCPESFPCDSSASDHVKSWEGSKRSGEAGPNGPSLQSISSSTSYTIMKLEMGVDS
jgi:hypothetical protein